MKFVSTRGRAPSVTAAEALVSGLAPDGGLYVPEYLPAPREDWEATADLTYAELAAEVLALFFTDWDKEELLTLCRKAYNGTFNMPGIIRVRKVGEKRYFTELFHGRTLAFKDMALSLFPHLLQAAKEKLGRTETTLILTATSGDTGKAALAGFQDVPGTEIVVFYPEHGVSPVQKWQMQTQAGENVHVYGVEGNFDDAQTFVKAAFEDPDLRAYAKDHGVAFSSANSINIGRLLPQIVYYIRTYAELVKAGEIKKGEAFDVCVPTGNFGNILAGLPRETIGRADRETDLRIERKSCLDRLFPYGHLRSPSRISRDAFALDGHFDFVELGTFYLLLAGRRCARDGEIPRRTPRKR